MSHAQAIFVRVSECCTMRQCSGLVSLREEKKATFYVVGCLLYSTTVLTDRAVWTGCNQQ